MLRSSRALLFGLLACTYLVTSGGHVSSNDEEQMFYATEGIFERGALALPLEEGRLLRAPVGADGQYYAGYGIGVSLVALPFYTAGRVAANAFPPEYRALIKRFTTTAVSALATATTAVVVAAILGVLGFPLWIQLSTALTFGFASIAWPYSKYLWSEPLSACFVTAAVLFALRAESDGRTGFWLAVTACLGAATLTKVTCAIFVPVFILWASTGPSGAALRRPKSLAVVMLGVLPFVGALLLYNVARFGNPIETGHGYLGNLPRFLDDFVRDPRMGLFGLTFSTGKGAFWYSPVLILAAAAAIAFARRYPRPAQLVGMLVAVQLAVHALVPFWSGDAAWGPRYLVPVTALMLLPIALPFEWAAHSRGWRAALGATVIVSVCIQLLGVLVNPQTYIFASAGETDPHPESRWFEPAGSPILAHFQILRERIGELDRDPGPDEYVFRDGFYQSEGSTEVPRWTDGHGALGLRAPRDGQVSAALLLSGPLVGSGRGDEIRFILDGKPLLAGGSSLPAAPTLVKELTFPVVADRVHILEIVSPTFVPTEAGGAQDRRTLGVRVESLVLEQDGRPLDLRQLPTIPPIPVSVEHPWSRGAFGWFYDPRFPHLLDLWPVYAWSSGLPRWTAGLVCIPLAGVVAFGIGLWRNVQARCRFN